MSEAEELEDFCFVHAADLHLGGRRWLAAPAPNIALAERIQCADRLALRALVDLCIAERARFLLCAGDVIDGWCRDYMVALRLVEELVRLRDADCQVVLLLGNHDVRSRMLGPLLLPGFARVLGIGGPETVVFERVGVALHGFSAPELREGDVAAAYPVPLAGLFNIGLLHTSAEGRRGHPDYAPCSRLTLRRHGYDYWALGHVHAREVIGRDPWIVFPGNLQGRGARESGPKGAMLVRVKDGRVLSAEHRALDALRFETLVVDTDGAQHFDDLLAALHRVLLSQRTEVLGRPLVARLVLSGVDGAACALGVPVGQRAAALANIVRETCGDSVWIDEVVIEAGDFGGWSLNRAA